MAESSGWSSEQSGWSSEQSGWSSEVETTDWQSRLRASGHRLTPQRELVLEAVEQLGHATPDQVYAAVRTKSQSINLSTVYRTLELLDELGLIRHAHLSDRAPTYHSARGHEHSHLVCRSCHAVISIARPEMESALGGLAEQHDFAPDYGHLTVFGLCAACGANPGPAEGGPSD